MAVNLLVSPHYFPDWAYEKWPHLRDGGGGFLKVDVQAPEARQVYEKFLRVTIPRIKDHPALHSICLSNEPVYTEGHKSQVVRQKWHEWLAARHGTVDALNKRWGSDYADFASIPPVSPDEFTPSPIAYDFVLFNCEAFAEFHAWMAGVIREMAPKLPLHAKIMICPNFQPPRARAVERFARVCSPSSATSTATTPGRTTSAADLGRTSGRTRPWATIFSGAWRIVRCSTPRTT